MKEPTLMQQNRALVADIDSRRRLRPVSEAGVESLIASIRETGVMKDAIHLRKKKDGTLVLIAGGHRLEAARRLGWTDIEAKVWTDVTDDWAAIMEIDDNLAGAEMNALDTAVFLAQRKQVYERLHPETSASAFKGNRHTGSLVGELSSFTSATAEKFGMTERQVQKIVAAGMRLGGDEVGHLRRAPRRVTLKDLIEIGKIGDDEERTMVVLKLSGGNAKTASAARAQLRVEAGDETPVQDPVDRAFKALLAAWLRAPKAGKRRFVDHIGAELAALQTSEDAA